LLNSVYADSGGDAVRGWQQGTPPNGRWDHDVWLPPQQAISAQLRYESHAEAAGANKDHGSGGYGVLIDIRTKFVTPRDRMQWGFAALGQFATQDGFPDWCKPLPFADRATAYYVSNEISRLSSLNWWPGIKPTSKWG